MKPEEAHFVAQHYHRFMTKSERFAYKRLRVRDTHEQSTSDKENRSNSSAFSDLVTDDPQLLELMKGGYEACVQRIAERIRATHRNEIVINRCPRCHKLARTPKARQCRFCGNDWHTAQ